MRKTRSTEAVRAVLRRAAQEASHCGRDYLGTEHILIGLAEEQESIAGQVLRSLGVEPGRIRRELEQLIRAGAVAAKEEESIEVELVGPLPLELRQALEKVIQACEAQAPDLVEELSQADEALAPSLRLNGWGAVGVYAREEARRLYHTDVGPEHWL